MRICLPAQMACLQGRVIVRSFFLALLLLSQTVFALEEVAQKHMENPSIVGKGRLKVLLFKVFDATLYAPEGQFNKQQPFALSLTYLRKLDGAKIAEKSIEEIRAQGVDDQALLDKWNKRLLDIFPDVKKGSNITGVRDSQGYTQFYFNGGLVGSVEDTQFTEHFFDIWLGESTSEPVLRKKLLNSGA